MALAINLDKDRVYRLCFLVLVASVLGSILQVYLPGLAAYSISVTLTVQVNNAIDKIHNSALEAEKLKISKAEARALGVNPKKAKKRKS
mmetsp:Transcript_19844/g.43412  ORF Transcript_19844/g.43412 Transcript_19844/m.43412 type:complete len:89 (-) Transcript_19844:635-901(-)